MVNWDFEGFECVSACVGRRIGDGVGIVFLYFSSWSCEFGFWGRDAGCFFLFWCFDIVKCFFFFIYILLVKFGLELSVSFCIPLRGYRTGRLNKLKRPGLLLIVL